MGDRVKRVLMRIKIHPTFPLVIFAGIFLEFFGMLIMVYIVAFLHEMAHIFVAGVLKVKVGAIEIMPFGITMRLESSYIKEPAKEIMISLAGPLSNFIMMAIAGSLLDTGLASKELLEFFIMINISMMVLNLMPIIPLDGGRALRGTLTIKKGFVKAYNFVMQITKIFAVIVILSGLAVLIISGFNFSLILIGAFLVSGVISEKRAGSLMVMRDILYNRYKLDGIMNTKCFISKECEPARKTLKNLSYNNYSIVTVVDENMQICGALTETEIVEGIIKKGIGVKLGNLI